MSGRRGPADWAPPRLYLITDRRAVPEGRSLLETIEKALVAAEPFRLQNGRLPMAVSLREKDLATGDLVSLALKVAAMTKTFGADLFVNGRVDVALACGAEGVHLPATELFPQEVRFLAPDLKVGSSTHCVSEVAAAAKSGVDFVVFGPVFDTPSKKGVIDTVGLSGLERATELPIAVIALGGITPANAGRCADVGAWGVACIRAISSDSDPAKQTVAFLAHF